MYFLVKFFKILVLYWVFNENFTVYISTRDISVKWQSIWAKNVSQEQEYLHKLLLTKTNWFIMPTDTQMDITNDLAEMTFALMGKISIFFNLYLKCLVPGCMQNILLSNIRHRQNNRPLRKIIIVFTILNLITTEGLHIIMND
jgi:hypothetical protein